MKSNAHTERSVSWKNWLAVACALVAVIAMAFALSGTGARLLDVLAGRPPANVAESPADAGFSYDVVPPYDGEAAVTINGNEPYFTSADLARDPFEEYSDLDRLGRCGPAFALVGPETMPDRQRESIGMVKPTGWQISQYDWVDGHYLFNRCHLIAFCLTGQNANPLNLITGTRSLNVVGMLPLEELVASYIDHTGNHVLYRVTPVFAGSDLVASGVLMEGRSVEDDGAGICYCVWCYNVEPGVVVDYATGDNRAGDPVTESYPKPFFSR